MSDQTSITRDLEHLFKKTTEANKTFFSESAKFIKNVNASNVKAGDIFSGQTELFKEALNLFVRLNIQHTSNLIDLGVAVTKRMNERFTGPDVPSEESKKPAFVLNMAAAAGDTASTEFLLDSDKKEPIPCHLKQTAYVLQADPSVTAAFHTSFSPQSFELNFGEPQRVEIHIEIPADTIEGIYLADVNVEGFEHTYFSLFLTIGAARDVPEKPASAVPGKTRKRKTK